MGSSAVFVQDTFDGQSTATGDRLTMATVDAISMWPRRPQWIQWKTFLNSFPSFGSFRVRKTAGIDTNRTSSLSVGNDTHTRSSLAFARAAILATASSLSSASAFHRSSGLAWKSRRT